MTHNSVADRQNPEELEESKSQIRDKTRNTSAAKDKQSMVTRGRKRLGKPNYREIAGLQ